MDVLYNDVEALYPFVNKVHPTLALVTIAARLLRAKTGGVTPVIEELDAMAAVAGAVAAAGLSPVNQRELKRARELWKSECDVVVFGHTHDRQDVTKSKGGRQLRLVDTGSWIPRITVNPWDPPSLEELKSAKPEHSIHYAWLELGAEVTATLETLVSGSG
jgi:UDP-2,3-diacylglucosamine pyrophosphatase LpxH